MNNIALKESILRYKFLMGYTPTKTAKENFRLLERNEKSVDDTYKEVSDYVQGLKGDNSKKKDDNTPIQQDYSQYMVGPSPSGMDLYKPKHLELTDWNTWYVYYKDNLGVHREFLGVQGDPEVNKKIKGFLPVIPKDAEPISKEEYFSTTQAIDPINGEMDNYLNSCAKYQGFVIIPDTDPETNLKGMELVRAINWGDASKSFNQEATVEYRWCCCKYMKDSQIWLPANGEAWFWNPGSIVDFTKQFYEGLMSTAKGQDLKKLGLDGVTEQTIIQELSQYLGVKSVQAAWIGGRMYNSSFKWDSGTRTVYFLGLLDDQKSTLPKPEWKDERNFLQRFIDDYGIIIQLGTSAIFLIVGIVTTLTGIFSEVGVFWVEAGIEGFIGASVAIRDLQKGQYIGAAMGAVFVLAPFMKFSNRLKGLPDAEIKDLGKKLIDSNLTTESSADEWFEFFTTKLTPTQQKAMRLTFMNSDAMVQKAIKEELENVGKNSDEAIELLRGIGSKLKESGKLKSIPFIKTLTAKEFLGVQAPAILLDFILNACCGDKLNDENKKRVETIYSVTPESLKKVWLDNEIFNANAKTDESIEFQEKYKSKLLNLDAAADSFIMYYNQFSEMDNKKFGKEDIGYQLEGQPKTLPEIVDLLKEYNQKPDVLKKLSDAGWRTVDEVGESKTDKIIFTNMDVPYNVLFHLKENKPEEVQNVKKSVD